MKPARYGRARLPAPTPVVGEGPCTSVPGRARLPFSVPAVRALGQRGYSIVVIAVGFKGLLRERSGIFETTGSEIGAAEGVPGSFTVGLALDGAVQPIDREAVDPGDQASGDVVIRAALGLRNKGVKESSGLP